MTLLYFRTHAPGAGGGGVGPGGGGGARGGGFGLLFRSTAPGTPLPTPGQVRSTVVVSKALTRDQLFEDILSGQHQMTVQAILMVDGQDREQLDDFEGVVKADAKALITRSLQMKLWDPKRFPKSIRDLIAPPNEVRVEMVLENWRRQAVTEPVGVFVLSEPKMSQGKAKWSLDINCFDRSRFVQRNRWRSPYGVQDGLDLAVFVRAAILTRDPYAQFEAWPATTGVLTAAGVLGVQTNNDPLQDLQKMCTGAGWRLSMGRRGGWTMYEAPDPTTSPVAVTYSDRDRRNRFLDATRSFSDVPGYNGVVGRSDPPAGTVDPVPIISEAWNEDPDSRLFRYGRWREVPRFWSSPLFYDQATLDKATATLLADLQAVTEKVQFTTPADPRRQPDEVYVVDRPSLGLVGRVLSTTISMPLDGNAMTITCVDRGSN